MASSERDPALALPCPSTSKRCGAECVSSSDPAWGCAGESCAPCALPGAQATCDGEGACAVESCVRGRGDCDGASANGCETFLDSSPRHCGGCGRVCAATEACEQGACVPASELAARRWLATQTAGFCTAAYNQVLNLCGDVRYCFDPRIQRPYPTGLAVDLGVLVGRDRHAALLGFGGDCDGEHVLVSVVDGELVVSGQGVPATTVALAPGKHLVSAQWSSRASAVFVDGRKVAEMGAPTRPLRLGDRCGPGLVLGGRPSYWWDAAHRETHGSAAFFFVHLREQVADAVTWDSEAALQAGDGTVLLFDATGVAGATWQASAGGLVGVGKNASNPPDDPRGGVADDGPLPEWKPLAACAVD